MYAQIIIAIVIFLAGAAGGIKFHAGQDAIKENARIAQERKDAREDAKNIDTASERHEVAKAKIETEYVTITKEVDRVVNKVEYRDRACFDDDGVRVLGRAVATANDIAGFPTPTVSSPAKPN